jgi:hypothetical protein
MHASLASEIQTIVDEENSAKEHGDDMSTGYEWDKQGYKHDGIPMECQQDRGELGGHGSASYSGNGRMTENMTTQLSI